MCLDDGWEGGCGWGRGWQRLDVIAAAAAVEARSMVCQDDDRHGNWYLAIEAGSLGRLLHNRVQDDMQRHFL